MNYDNELIDWSFVWEWLPQLKLREPYVVGCYKDGDMDFRYGMNVFNKERMGEYISRGLLSAETTMFLTEGELPLNDKCSWDSIWNHIEVPFTEEGLWQAFLLDELWRMLPLGWHWAYHKDTYLLKLGDLDSVWKDAAELTLLEIEELEEPWKSRMLEDMLLQQKVKEKLKKEEHLLLPHIEIDEKRHHAIIHYTYWSDWEGVVAVKLPVSYVDGLIVWGDREKTVLLPYDCGILY